MNQIIVDKNGFSKQKLVISMGQNVTFLWDNSVDNNEKDVVDNMKKPTAAYSIIQVIDDEIEGKFRPVVDGYHSGEPTFKGSIVFNFKLIGEFKFKIYNHSHDPSPCTIFVTEEHPYHVKISDDGFEPKYLKIDEGRSIKWDWSYCSFPHSIYDAEFCDFHVGLFRTNKELVVPACSNTYKRTFTESGLYYFQTESKNKEKKHICVVEVTESFKDHKVDIYDSRFSPMLLAIEEGDRVWFSWNSNKCQKKHAIYEINLPMPDHQNNEPYYEKKNGFKWSVPTRSGLLCHCFETCGVYYYSDIVENECSSYIGIIVVKPKSSNHDIVIQQPIVEPDLKPIEAGDRIWWRWDLKMNVSISLLDGNLLYDKKLDFNKCLPYGGCEEIESNSLSRFGVFSSKISKPGVYYYKIQIENSFLISTIVATPPPKDHKIEVSDYGFHPSIININPEDRIWFVWTDTKKSHNIRQVTHQDQYMKNGFLSGSLMESPAAFMQTFSEQGIFYFHSDGLKNCLGAVVVVPEPTVQVIRVKEDGIFPDPLVAGVYDTVLWVFPSIQKFDLVEITNQNDLLTYPMKAEEIIGRKYISRSFKESNVYHFASPSFNSVLNRDEMDSKGYKNIVLSSVIIDKKFEYVLITVDKEGFHPDYINIGKNKSVLFDWKETNELHNIIHVKRPSNEKTELIKENIIFTSKEKTLNDNFLYTFEEEGEYYIASEGATGRVCIVNVLNKVSKTAIPKLVNREPTIINKYHKIHLHCDTPGATIYYTLNGMQPNKNSQHLKLYDIENGILLTEIGFCFVRAVAISEGCEMSDIFTSQRFFVIDGYNLKDGFYDDPEPNNLSNEWWRAIPKITINYSGDGCLEVMWEKIPETTLALISYYQLFLNRVSYKQKIRPDANFVLVKGLCGNRSYEINLMVFPKSKSYLPQQSNIVIFRCPLTTNTGGPLISLKANSINNQITLVWHSVETEKLKIEFYQLIINDEKKQIIKSDSKINKVIVDGFEYNHQYSIMIIAVPKNSLIPLMSNEINIKFPLRFHEISLPDPALRDQNKDFYDEYIFINDKNISKNVIKLDGSIKNNNTQILIAKRNLDINLLNNQLPIPKVSASCLNPGSILIEWKLTKLPQLPFEIDYFVISIIGTEFTKNIKSDSSYDCFMEINNMKVPAVQHCWNMSKNIYSLVVDGIYDTSIYQIFVTAIYYIDKINQTSELKKSSPVINHISLGPPHAPKLRIINIDLQSVTVEWSISDYPKPEYISGYRLLVNSDYKEKFSANQHEFIFNELKPGKSYTLELVVLTNSIIGQSESSKPLTIICPKRPNSPLIYQSSTLKVNSVVISWKPVITKSLNKEDQIQIYKVYLNNHFHGEIFSSNLSTYSYIICDLIPGNFYDVSIKATCGQRSQLPIEDDIIYCLVSSDASNVLSVTPTAPPLSPSLRLESIHPDGIDVTWVSAIQYGEATISGYQLIINGISDNKILPPDSIRTTIRNINLGDILNLQIMALTNHPCGQYSIDEDKPNYNVEYALLNESKINNKNIDINAVYKNYRYSACKPGPSLFVNYTNLVLPPVKIRIEKITGHSAIITWELNSDFVQPFIKPEYYSVTYWKKNDFSDENIKCLTTKNDYIHLDQLSPSTVYVVTIESRKEFKLIDVNNSNEKTEYIYLNYSKTNEYYFETVSPPSAPSNLSVIISTCHGLRISWCPPVDNGSELIAIRVQCFPINNENPNHFIKEFTPDVTECKIENLNEKTKYRIIVTAITEEYLIQHKKKILTYLNDKLEPNSWLPSSYIDVETSGTEPASNLKLKMSHDKKPIITWSLAKTYGSNILISQILCYSDLNNQNSLNNQIVLPSDTNSSQINKFKVGFKYKVWIEAVVSIKLSLDYENERNNNFLHYNELKDRRTIHILSEAIIIRIPAPCESPVLFLTGYSTNTIDLYWYKPSMYSEHLNPENPNDNYIVYRRLMGYKIEVNGIIQKELTHKDTVCTLTNCKPSNTYNIILVARTCIEDEYTNLKETNNIEIDESYSHTLQIKLFSENDEKALKQVQAKFEEFQDEDATIGKIRVNWLVQDSQCISQYNLNWFISEEAISHRKSLDSNCNNCLIPIKNLKSIVEIYLEIVYKNLKNFCSERLSIEVPGSPDSPKLWLVEKKNPCTFLIHWSEPRTYNYAPCTGYQLYINEAKVGNAISFDTQKAEVPLKPSRSYKISIQALCSRIEFGDSKLSNFLLINTLNDNSPPNPIIDLIDTKFSHLKEFYNQENANSNANNCNIPIKISRLSEEFIEIDWTNFVSNERIDKYKIEWHCWNTDNRNEIILDKTMKSFSIQKCYPGYIYSIRVIAIQNETVINKSKFIIIETNAPPETPILKLRACNLKYITIEWNKPRSYGDAKVVGYKVYIDGKGTAIVSNDQTAFTLSNGTPCHEYNFQIQALTQNENIYSQISESLFVFWPGVRSPILHVIESKNCSVKIGWEEPKTTGNMKISFYYLKAYCEQTDNYVIQGPLEPSLLECELNNLDYGRHKIQLEINIYGITDPFLSIPLFLDLGSKPDTPILSAVVPAMEERIKLDNIACRLINKRDRILRIITNNGISKQYREITKTQLEKLKLILSQLEEALDDCLNLSNLLTGFFIINLSWHQMQSNKLMKITGFKIYVNGKQYGTDLPASITNIRIKLSLDQVFHTIGVTSFSTKPFVESEMSNIIEICTEKFLQFSFFCYNNTHNKNALWPKYGCCAFQDSIAFERLCLAKTKEIINIGFYSIPHPFPICNIYDIMTEKTKPIIDYANNQVKINKVKIILIWAKWCLPSMRMLQFFVSFARKYKSQYEFITCHHGNESIEEIKELLKRTGFVEDFIKYYSDSSEVLNIHDVKDVSFINTYEIKGIPFIMILKDCLLSWKGRYCCYEYILFERFMHHTLNEVMDLNCTNNNCENCNNDFNIDKELHELRIEQNNLKHYKDIIKRPLLNNNKHGLSKPRTIKQLISVEDKPYTITKYERYLQEINLSRVSQHNNEINESLSEDSLGFCYFNLKKRNSEAI